LALLAAEPTVSVTLWTTPLPLDEALREPPLDERPFLDAVLRDPRLREPLLFARLLVPEVVRLARERLDAAVDRLELGRFDPEDLVPPPLVLLLLVRALDERCVVSAMEATFPRLCRSLPGGPSRHARR
jgi:hypothetical protein